MIMGGYFWRIWAVLLVLSVVWLGWCMKTSQPAEAQTGAAEVITAQAFELVDAKGNVRMSLSTDPDGSAGLWLGSAKGVSRALLGAHPDGSTELALFDAGENLRAMLMILDDGSPGMWFYDAGNEVRAVLGTHPDGTPMLDLMGADGEFLFSAP
jgi:hypothetical protein